MQLCLQFIRNFPIIFVYIFYDVISTYVKIIFEILYFRNISASIKLKMQAEHI